MGDGVRELEEASDGDGVMEPSSEPRADKVSWSESSAASGGCRREDRVLSTGVGTSTGGALRAGRATVFATRCLGASGGLFAAG